MAVKKVTWQTSSLDTLTSSVHKAQKVKGSKVVWTVQGATSSQEKKVVVWSSNMTTTPAGARPVRKDKKRVNRWASCN